MITIEDISKCLFCNEKTFAEYSCYKCYNCYYGIEKIRRFSFVYNIKITGIHLIIDINKRNYLINKNSNDGYIAIYELFNDSYFKSKNDHKLITCYLEESFVFAKFTKEYISKMILKISELKTFI